MRNEAARFYHVEKGRHGCWEADILPPDKTEVALDLQVGDRQRSQDALLYLQGDGEARDHGNPQLGHDRLLDPFTPLQDEGVALLEMVDPESVFGQST